MEEVVELLLFAGVALFGEVLDPLFFDGVALFGELFRAGDDFGDAFVFFLVGVPPTMGLVSGDEVRRGDVLPEVAAEVAALLIESTLGKLIAFTGDVVLALAVSFGDTTGDFFALPVAFFADARITAAVTSLTLFFRTPLSSKIRC